MSGERWQDYNYGKWKEEDAKFDHKSRDEASVKILTEMSQENDWEALTKLGELPRPPWKPSAYYNKDGDQIEVWLSNESYYAHWLNPQIAVFLSHETKEIVGLEICGIAQLFKDEFPANAEETRRIRASTLRRFYNQNRLILDKETSDALIIDIEKYENLADKDIKNEKK